MDKDAIGGLLTTATTIAVVGASKNPDRPVYGVMKMLIDSGYRVLPVNPGEVEVFGVKSYASLKDIHEPVDIVDVFRRAEATPDIARDAVAIGAKALWLQLGIVNEEAARIATEGGLQVVMDRCIAVDHRVFGVPNK